MNRGTLSRGVPNGMSAEKLQTMLLNVLGEKGLKYIFQKESFNEVVIDKEGETAQQKEKLNKSAIKGIMSKKK